MLDFLYRWTFYISCLPCFGEIGRAAILVQKARFFAQPRLQPAAASRSCSCTVFFTSLYPE